MSTFVDRPAIGAVIGLSGMDAACCRFAAVLALITFGSAVFAANCNSSVVSTNGKAPATPYRRERAGGRHMIRCEVNLTLFPYFGSQPRLKQLGHAADQRRRSRRGTPASRSSRCYCSNRVRYAIEAQIGRAGRTEIVRPRKQEISWKKGIRRVFCCCARGLASVFFLIHHWKCNLTAVADDVHARMIP